MYFLYLAVLLSFPLASSAEETAPDSPTVAVTPVENITDVSIVNLIATPEKYVGKHVRLIGVLSLNFEDTALYLDKEAYEFYRMNDAVFLHVDKTMAESAKKFVGRYVVVEGVFRLLEGGGTFAGDLERVTRIDPVAQRE